MISFIKKVWKVNKTLGFTVPKPYIELMNLKSGELIKVTLERVEDSTRNEGVDNRPPKDTRLSTNPTPSQDEKEEGYY